MVKNYVKFGPIGLTAWQYEIYGCLIFYMLAGVGIFTYLYEPTNFKYPWMILIPSFGFLLIGILSPINVYYKEKAGYYDDPYYPY